MIPLPEGISLQTDAERVCVGKEGEMQEMDTEKESKDRQGREELVPLKASLLLPEPLVSTFLL